MNDLDTSMEGFNTETDRQRQTSPLLSSVLIRVDRCNPWLLFFCPRSLWSKSRTDRLRAANADLFRHPHQLRQRAGLHLAHHLTAMHLHRLLRHA
jgi:hypothetical protein